MDKLREDTPLIEVNGCLTTRDWFVKLNVLPPAEVDAINDLEPGERAVLGGGATPEYVVERVS